MTHACYCIRTSKTVDVVKWSCSSMLTVAVEIYFEAGLAESNVHVCVMCVVSQRPHLNNIGTSCCRFCFLLNIRV